MPQFTGQLRSNEIFAALFNMIISQRVYADNIKGVYALVDKARVDGSLYGDTKLYYSTDALHSHPWGADAEAPNLLAIKRPKAPEQQAIYLDKFFQIDLTVDYYLSKRAWGDEGAFMSFTDVMLGWLRESKRVIDATTYNAFIGTAVSLANRAVVEVDVSTARGNASSETEANQLEALTIGESLANLMVDMKDATRDFNDYKQLRSYDEGEIIFVFNSRYVNRMKYIDLPTVFHNQGVEDKITKNVLPARFFGTVITASNISSFSASTPAAGKPIDSDNDAYTPGSNHTNGCIRTLIEVEELEVGGVKYDLYPGDEIPAGATIKSGGDFEPGEVYIEEADVICKVFTEYPPFMSAFEVGTSFFNQKSLTESHFLTWGRNSLEYLFGKPFITVKAK